ncbi:MAG: AmmeMemoRadiSam system protein B [Candidatus Omnitrophica bacterium]|nr:AmmeMemoRadiSam system protein B [Candidatus Omnitrophota bacterium]
MTWYNNHLMNRFGLTLRIAAGSLLALLLAAGSALAEPRTAKVAGKFYPEERAELDDVVRYYLDRQSEPAVTQKPRMLIVPHAGYQYSAVIAASGYRHLHGHTYDGVVVVGFTHRVQFEGSSVEIREAYETPLGELPIHPEAVAVLQTYPGITHQEEVHESDEHSVEVQLPFLQVALERPRVVPILMGSARLEDAERLAEALAGLARTGDYLFVFSTDLSHYHPYSEAETIDEGTVNAILFETPQAVYRLFQRGEMEACGRGPIVTSLLLAAKLGYPRRELLSYANSGDTAGNPSNVVGYAALAMFDQADVTPAGRISPKAGAALVKGARLTLDMRFQPERYKNRIVPLGLDGFAELSKASGLFVTLRKQGRLRGCIGRIETDEPLASALPKVALDAALRDSRFQPVTAGELPELHVEVSVLTPPVKLSDPKELVAGRDGVILESQGRRGVFLPQVWEETGWTRVEFLRELASQKAGLPPDAWERATLYTFQDQIFEESR